jgi:hypothetical protein
MIPRDKHAQTCSRGWDISNIEDKYKSCLIYLILGCLRNSDLRSKGTVLSLQREWNGPRCIHPRVHRWTAWKHGNWTLCDSHIMRQYLFTSTISHSWKFSQLRGATILCQLSVWNRLWPCTALCYLELIARMET